LGFWVVIGGLPENTHPVHRLFAPARKHDFSIGAIMAARQTGRNHPCGATIAPAQIVERPNLADRGPLEIERPAALWSGPGQRASANRTGRDTMAISQKIRGLITTAWDDGAPCLVATQGADGPNISPKGSMVVFDDGHLAYWERSKKQALANLGHDKRVCVIYANFKAQRDGILDSGFLRFYGTAELHEAGPIHDAIFRLLLPREQTHVGADTGIGVLVKIERAADVRGKALP
jgi:uncharacterized protein